MGQRLNIEIIKNGKTIANCYYHWSAYTLSSLIETNMVIEYYNKLLKQNLPDEVLAVKMFENCKSFSFLSGKDIYAGLTEESFKYMCKTYPNYNFQKAEDRNAGLIGVTEKDMENTRKYEEGEILINLDKETIDAIVMIDYLEKEEFIDECLEDYGIKEKDFNYDKLPEFSYDFNEIPFDKLEEIIEDIKENNKKHQYVYKSKDGLEVIRLIE